MADQHTFIDDISDSESDPELDAELDPDQQQFYYRQQQQAMYYQQHTQVHGSATDLHAQSPRAAEKKESSEEDGMYSDDDESSTASIPDENIDFSLTYALWVVFDFLCCTVMTDIQAYVPRHCRGSSVCRQGRLASTPR